MPTVVLFLAICIMKCVPLLGESRPNVLLLFPDQWRFDWADQYYTKNLSIKTPTFDSIVQNGTRFIHNTVGSPLCAPSRACIAAGKEYDYTHVPNNKHDFPENTTTFYKLLQNSGYWTMVSGKDDLTKKSGCGINGTYRLNELGFDAQRRCKGKEDNTASYPTTTDPFAVYLSQHYSLNHQGNNDSEWAITDWCNQHCCNGHECTKWTTVDDPGYEDNWITDNTVNMLDNIPVNQAWFLQINWAGPHPPFIITKAMNESINNRSYAYPIDGTENKEVMLETRRDYSAEIENLDKAFSMVINKLHEIKQYENTIICVSSDHGEMLGDYNAWGKTMPWVASTNTPFVCMGPGIKKNKIISTYVSNMDIAGTVLDYANVKPLQDMTTISLKPFLNGTWNDNIHHYRPYVSSGLNGWRNAIKDVNETTTWKFVCCQKQCPVRTFPAKDGLVQLLFNIVDDIYEQNNVAKLYPDVVEEMKSYLPPNFCVAGTYTWTYDNEY